MRFLKAKALLEEQLFQIHSSDTVDNFYSVTDRELDLPGAARLRRANLMAFLASMESCRFLFLGEAPGPHGARFSGIPFTSESQALSGIPGFVGHRTSQGDQARAERTATIFWQAIGPLRGSFFTWNAYPLLPHLSERKTSLRNPGRREIQQFEQFTTELIRSLNPENIIAVGRKAEYFLGRAHFPHIYLRHPSHGGARAFQHGIWKLIRG